MCSHSVAQYHLRYIRKYQISLISREKKVFLKPTMKAVFSWNISPEPAMDFKCTQGSLKLFRKYTHHSIHVD